MEISMEILILVEIPVKIEKKNDGNWLKKYGNFGWFFKNNICIKINNVDQ